MPSKTLYLRLFIGALSLLFTTFFYFGLQTETAEMAKRYDGSSSAAPASFFDPNVDGPVNDLAIQPDGRILIGGDFDNVGGVAHSEAARLNVDGTVDPTFVDQNVRGVTNDSVAALKLAPDGKVLIGGDFAAVGDSPPNGSVTGIARLNSNGTFDPFYPVTPGGITTIDQQTDGKVLLGGYFTSVYGAPRKRLVRISYLDWNVDTTFQDTGLDGIPLDTEIQPDGKIVVGGQFTVVNGVAMKGIARLNSDGTLDSGFSSPFTSAFSSLVRTLKVQPDGKIIVGGYFYLGSDLYKLIRLNADGSVDPTFHKPMFDDQPYDIAIDADGKIVLGGHFFTVEGQQRSGLLRLNTDGTLDASFPNPRVGGYVNALAIQSDGKIVIGGNFAGVAGWTRRRVARLNPDGSLEANPPALELVVTKTADSDDGVCNADCSLREALANALSNNELTRVTFDPAVFSVPQTITLSLGELVFQSSRRIDLVGPGANLLTISGNDQSRVMRIAALAPTSLTGITFTHGNGAGASFSGSGGALYVAQDNDNILISNCTFVQNKAGSGGAIYASASVTLTDSTVANNESTNGTGGGIYVASGTMNIVGSTISGNSVSSSISALGGGIYNNSTFGGVVLMNSTVSGNTARMGGGLSSSGNSVDVRNTLFQNNVAQNGSGGGMFIESGNVTVSDSTFRSNQALNGSGGGVYILRIGSITRTTFDHNSAPNGGGLVVTAANMTGRELTFTGNSATGGSGGALYINNSTTAGQNYLLTDSIVSDNTATQFGGGIYNRTALVVTNSAISNNTATSGGGALMQFAAQGPLSATFAGCLINGNRSGASGGAIQTQAGAVSLINSTMSANDAQGLGGAVLLTQSAVLNLAFATIAFNTANATGGVYSSSSTINSNNSIIANNTTRNSGAQVTGSFVSQGFNLLSQTTGATITGDTTGNILNVDPQLERTLSSGPPAQRVHRLRPDSPAIDAGMSVIGSVEIDQRGRTRPYDDPARPNSGDAADIGAFEKQADDLTTVSSPFDFDGDGKTDIGIFRPNGGEWWINRSGNGQTFALQFGSSSDVISPADYTGDGKTDIAFFRPSSGEWYVLRSEDFSFFALPFGTNGDVPVPADYDADGKADFAVFRPSSSTWFISQSGGAATRIFQFGITGDVPVVADYDADGRADVGIFRQAAGGGEWWINRSTAGLLAMQFGASTDKPVQGDYTGDGKADIAIWRPSSGEWLIVRSEDFSFYGFPFGTNGDVVAPGDYDGDGKFDVTVFRPSSATWFISRTTAGTQIVQFGANGDRPLPNAFVP